MLFNYCPYSIVYISITIDSQQIMSITGSSSAVSKHIPGFKLTDKERAEKCAKHKLGLCCSCDAGFDYRSDYIHYPHPSGVYCVCMCVGCIGYYAETGQLFDFDKFLEGGSAPSDGNEGGSAPSDGNGGERRGTEGNGGERRGTEWNGNLVRRKPNDVSEASQ